MTPEQFIQEKAAAAVKALYQADVEASTLQVGVTRKEFEGDYTLVVFPLLKISRSAPEATGNAIGAWLTEKRGWWYNISRFCATVAQLDRALASEAEGCWFDPSQSHQSASSNFIVAETGTMWYIITSNRKETT